MTLSNNVETAVAAGSAVTLYTTPIGAEAALSTLFFNAIGGTANLTLSVHRYASGLTSDILEDFPINDDEPFTFPKPIMLAEGDYLSFLATGNNIIGYAGFYEDGSAVTAAGTLNPRGEYSAVASYDRLDVVESGGSTYICLTDSTTADAPPSVNWMLSAEKGDDGVGGVPTTGGTFTGPVKVTELQETVVALSGTTPDVDLETGTVFTLTTSGNTTFTFSNPAVTGTASGFTLTVEAGGTHTLTYPASVVWSGGTQPDDPASGEVDVLAFFTVDGGTTWFGFQAGDAMA